MVCRSIKTSPKDRNKSSRRCETLSGEPQNQKSQKYSPVDIAATGMMDSTPLDIALTIDDLDEEGVFNPTDERKSSWAFVQNALRENVAVKFHR
jgi:hypothetical protein